MKVSCVLALIFVGISIVASNPPPTEAPSQLEFTTGIPESTVDTEIKGYEVDLDFSDLGLSRIRPNSISGLNIKSLVMRDNSIEYLQNGTFDSLPSLEHLDLSGNRISKENLFSFGSIPSLKSLILDNNYPRRDDDCRCPRRYSSHENYDINHESSPRYSALETTADFPEVTHLSMRNILMDFVPDSWLSKFPKVMMLDISNNPLTALDYSLKKFPSTVKNLTLENVGVRSLSTKSLENVTTLNLNYNNFETLSSSFCYERTLCLTNVNELETLLVANNSIETIKTDAFKDLQKLIHLDISNNSLRKIPHGVFEYLHSLSYLDMSENYLGKIPNISTLSNLDTLKMDNMKNGLVLADPRDMPAMPRIRFMSLRGNGIKHVPENFLSKFPGIQEIDLSNNKLITLNPGLWPTNLKKINLSHNQIGKIEDLQLDHATSLEVLDLENNNIRGMNVSAVQLLPRSVFLKV